MNKHPTGALSNHHPRQEQKRAVKNPLGWDPSLTFLRAPIYAHPTWMQTPFLIRDLTPVPSFPASPNPSVLIRVITDASHPACHQRGLFSTREIEKGELILCYTGRVTSREDPSTEQSDHCIAFGHPLAIDADAMGITVDVVCPHHVVCRPNVAFRDVVLQHGLDANTTTDRLRTMEARHVRIGVFSLARISAGEEILVSYGKGFWKARTHPSETGE